MPRWISGNLAVIFWAILLGEVIGYIVSAIEGMTYNMINIAIVASVAALILVNGVSLLLKDQD